MKLLVEFVMKEMGEWKTSITDIFSSTRFISRSSQLGPSGIIGVENPWEHGLSHMGNTSRSMPCRLHVSEFLCFSWILFLHIKSWTSQEEKAGLLFAKKHAGKHANTMVTFLHNIFLGYRWKLVWRISYILTLEIQKKFVGCFDPTSEKHNKTPPMAHIPHIEKLNRERDKWN